MKEIKDVFKREQFSIDHIREYHGDPAPTFIINLKRRLYEISFTNLDRVLSKYEINLWEELRRNTYRRERIDNRPLWKKDMDMRMGKMVDFRNKAHHIQISDSSLERELLAIIKHNEARKDAIEKD